MLIAGEQVPVDAPTIAWPATGWAFPGLKHRPTTRSVVWHWTGAEGGAGRVYQTLVERRLSVHFCIERDGRLVQYCDTEARCSHAGAANGCAIGVEMVNRADMSRDAGGISRELVRETIHGEETIATTFLPPQVSTALALAEVLSERYHLPMAVPMSGSDVLPTVMPPGMARVFLGHTAHFHWSLRKRDCGLTLMRAIAAHSLRQRQGE